MLNITPNFAQERGLAMLRQSWKQNRTFMIYSPTGSGKTGLAAFITNGYIKRNMRVMFCAPYTILIAQTAERFQQYGIPMEEIGFVWADHPNYDPTKLVQIASADTLIRREFPDNIDLLIIDEAHLRRKKILEVIRDTDIKVIGLSGTPFSPFLGKYYEMLIKPTTMKELIERGDLSKYEFYAPTKPDLSKVKSSRSREFGADYKEDEIAEIMSGADLVGDLVSNWLANGENLPTICFCVTVSHANFVTVAFNRAGVNAEIITADTPHDERQVIVHRFEQGATKIIVNVGTLVAGFDSDVRCIIYARPTKSEIRWVQCLGRGLRKAPGKDKCLIFDHSGSVLRLGFPDDIEYDDLSSKSDGMQEADSFRENVKTEKTPKECSSCHYIKPAGVYVCPKCGFKPLAGEDIEVDDSRNIKKMSKKPNAYTQQDKQSFYSQLKYYQNIRATEGKPLSDGWVANTYKEKFGCFPRGMHDMPQELTPEVSNYIKHKQIKYVKARQKLSAQIKEVRTKLDNQQQQESLL
nr:DEAD/DEAH box helicase [Providencia stuartii]ELR5082479.1 DEAD/DEAH box helicase [Providencia stuartii]